ncbi:hypothetical protein D3C73_1065540 [compost metagenome]
MNLLALAALNIAFRLHLFIADPNVNTLVGVILGEIHRIVRMPLINEDFLAETLLLLGSRVLHHRLIQGQPFRNLHLHVLPLIQQRQHLQPADYPPGMQIAVMQPLQAQVKILVQLIILRIQEEPVKVTHSCKFFSHDSLASDL